MGRLLNFTNKGMLGCFILVSLCQLDGKSCVLNDDSVIWMLLLDVLKSDSRKCCGKGLECSQVTQGLSLQKQVYSNTTMDP